MSKKAIIIGLDGATWDILEPWANKGLLPNLKKMMDNGVYGNLESTYPPVTAPAWVSFATGKNPGKHGCYDFLLPRNSLNDLKPITSKDIKTKTIYEILNENGEKCILINLPVSFPPKIKETVITDFMTQGDEFIFPPTLKEEIPELKNYRLIPDESLLIGKNKINNYIEDIRQLERTRFKCAAELFKKDWDFFFLLFSGTDWAQHQIYHKLISKKRNDKLIALNLYRDIDKYIGWFIDNLPKNTDMFIMSDHGFKLYHRLFFPNAWLKEKGYLIEEQQTYQVPSESKQEEERRKLISEKKVIKVPNILVKFAVNIGWLVKIYNFLPFRINNAVYQPNILNTKALNMIHKSPIGGIYINSEDIFTGGQVKLDEYEILRNDIMSNLKEIIDPKTGKQIIRKIWKKEELYNGSQLNLAPDIIYLLDDKYVITNKINSKTFIDYEIGTHSMNGIFIAYGPDIKTNNIKTNFRIYDLVPTILYMKKLPVPNNMDGRILFEIFKEDTKLSNDNQGIYKENQRKILQDKLNKLKYLNKI